MSDLGTKLAERMTKTERETKWANVRPVDAATLILIDRSGPQPKVLMGKRRHDLKFMPGKFVFPGGRRDPDDRTMPVYGTLDERAEQRLMARVQRPSQSRARSLALTAIRETYEETGILLGTKEAGGPPSVPKGWEAFAEHGVFPNLESLQFVARAITPPRRPKRFDTRFFACDADHIAHQVEGIVGAHAELVELKWLTLEDAIKEDLPTITTVVLEELGDRIAKGFSPFLPVPFYFMVRKVFHRAEL
ncbi:NUDIX domain-containing protein [Phreatobacter aquaticus]|uniref:NUDIX domain-containing protein n=1 Tax=Phreatobacter aquaticus TaxID=2570229 RepID=A0A4D7QKS5_9HYPH|nr:NUDIX domain-containing protein [Phreatobacter aquaticus]QCK87645.1 NUDIX domain-containing protein [Phreatobacter aquaticus]